MLLLIPSLSLSLLVFFRTRLGTYIHTLGARFVRRMSGAATNMRMTSGNRLELIGGTHLADASPKTFRADRKILSTTYIYLTV